VKFEESLAKLEETVRAMESGKLGIDDMMKAFETGRKIAAECEKELESIRLKIEKVTETGVERLEIPSCDASSIP